MQTRIRIQHLFLLAGILFLASCSKSNKEGRYIPKNAGVVVLVNGESISSKLPWSEVKQNDLFKKLYTDSTLDAFVKSALDNPENTGIDTKKNFLFFFEKDSLGGYIAIEGSVKDAAKFKSFIASAAKNATETKKDDVLSLSGERTGATWDKDRFVILIDAPETNNANNFGIPDTLAPAPKATRNITVTSNGIFNLKEDASLAGEEKFTDMLKNKADLHFWMNAASLNSGATSPAMAALSMLNLSKLYEGSVTTAAVNFENGQINVDMKSYSGKEMTEITKKYSGSSINSDMIKRIPAKDVAVLFAMNFKPEGIREFIKLAGLEGFANMGTGFLGFSLDDFIKANKGDIVFSLSDISQDSAGKPTMNAIFSASIGDKNAFGKLIDAGNKLGKEKLGGMTPPIFYNSNDNYFAIGSQKESVDKFIGSASNSSLSFLDKFKDGPVAFYLNFKSLLTGFAGNAASRDSLDNIAYQATLNMWETVIANGGTFKDGGVNQHIEINLVNKKENSLKLLNTYLGTLGNIQQQKTEYRNKMMSESASVDFDAPVIEESSSN